jgi:hypothetical protein
MTGLLLSLRAPIFTEMALVCSPISQSLHCDGSTRYNTVCTRIEICMKYRCSGEGWNVLAQMRVKWLAAVKTKLGLPAL